MKTLYSLTQISFAFMICCNATSSVLAEETTQTLELARGKLRMEVPSDWQRKEKPGFVEAEFSVPKDGKPEEVARITMMASGGSIKDNIERWYGQFQQADGSSTADRAKLEELKIADMKVHWVQITGSFKDSMGAGPFQRAPAVLRENYAMLGAIAETKDAGLYFFKATGPATTIDKLAPEFKEALKTLQPKK